MKHPKKMDSLGNFNDTNLDFTYQPFNTFQNGMLNYYKKRRKEVLDCDQRNSSTTSKDNSFSSTIVSVKRTASKHPDKPYTLRYSPARKIESDIGTIGYNSKKNIPKEISVDRCLQIGTSLESLENYYKEGNEKIKKMNEQLQNQIKNLNVVQSSGKSKMSIDLVNRKLKEKSDLCDEYVKKNKQQQIENGNLINENMKLKAELEMLKKEKDIDVLKIKNEYSLLLDTSKKDIENLELTKNKITQQNTKYKTLLSTLKKENILIKKELLITQLELKKKTNKNVLLDIEKVNEINYVNDNYYSDSIINTEQRHKHNKTEYLIKLIEKENDDYRNKLSALEEQLDIYIKNKSRINTSASQLSENSFEINNNNDAPALLYDFYSKASSIMKMEIIPYANITEKKDKYNANINEMIISIEKCLCDK